MKSIMQGSRVREGDRRDGWYEIDSQTAQDILDSGCKNRKMNEARAEGIGEQITSGLWRENGETIIFDDKERLLDGQHRLLGCVLSGLPIVSYCVFGINPKYFASLDTGASRGSSDVASLLGFSNAALVAAASRLIFNYRQSGGKTIENKGRTVMESLSRFMEDNSAEINEAVHAVGRHRKGLAHVVPPSQVAFIYFCVKDKEAAERFMQKLSTGEGLEAGSAILLFRQRMTANAGKKLYMDTPSRVALLIKTWNAFFLDKSVSLLRLGPSEPFPKIIEQQRAD